MQLLGLNEERTVVKKGFWRRQFQTETTPKQNDFDWVFGVVLPVICFAFDPLIFKGGITGTAFLGTYKPFAYLLSFASVMAMSAWLIWGAQLKWANALLAGFFTVGAVVSLAVGIVLLPLSLIGLIVIIGVLGFTPLFTALVFARNAVRAFRCAGLFVERRSLIYAFTLSLLFGAIEPAVMNLEIQRALDRISDGDVETIRANASGLKFVAPIVNFDSLAFNYRSDDKTEENEARAAAFQYLTGEEINSRSTRLHD